MISVESLISFAASNRALILDAAFKHLLISAVAISLGFAVAFPTGILLTRNDRLAGVALGFFGMVNTIPSLVLLGVAMMFLGIGFAPAVAVLFVYSLLPILRNTYTGIKEIDYQYIKAARGMGMNGLQILTKVQVPLALPVIVAGVRLSSVYVISWSTLAAFIGAGGFGDLIWMGLQSYNYNMIYSGAIPATVLALGVSFALTYAERLVKRRSYREAGVKR